MDNSETLPTGDLATTLNEAGYGWRARVIGRYPDCAIRDAIHQGKRQSRFIAIAVLRDQPAVCGIFSAEREHATGKITITDRIEDEPMPSEGLPEPFRTMALEPAVGLLIIHVQGRMR